MATGAVREVAKCTADDIIKWELGEVLSYFRASLFGILCRPNPNGPNLTKSDAAFFLSLIGSTPIGAELGSHILGNDLNILETREPDLLEQQCIVTLNAIHDSLEVFPLKDLKSSRSKEDQWYLSHESRWYQAADHTKLVVESLLEKILNETSSSPSVVVASSTTSSLVAILLSSRACRNKLCQLIAELWLWYRPRVWTRLNSLIAHSITHRQHTGNLEQYLLPSYLLFGSLREIAWQLSASAEGIASGSSKEMSQTARKSSWEMGRISASHRTTITTELSEMLELCWKIALGDLEIIQHNKVVVDDYLTTFAEIVQLQVPLLITTNNFDQLSVARWDLFASDLVAQSDRLRELCECLCEVNRAISSRKNKRCIKDDMSPSKHREYIMSFLAFLSHAQKRYHPLIISQNDLDDINLMTDGVWIIHSLLEQLALFMERSTASQIRDEVTTATYANLALALCHPSLCIASATLTAYRAMLHLGKFDPSLGLILQCLIWLRLVRTGDPQLRGLQPKQSFDWIANQLPLQLLNSALATLGLPRKESLDWGGLCHSLLEIEDEALSVAGRGTQEDSYASKLASMKNSVKSLIQMVNVSPNATSNVSPVVSTIVQSIRDFAGILLQSPIFKEALITSYLPANGALLKSVHAKVRGYLCPAYVILDFCGFIIEICSTAESTLPELQSLGSELLDTILRCSLSFVDTNVTMVESNDGRPSQRAIIDNRSGALDPHHLPSHWSMIEYKRLDTISQCHLIPTNDARGKFLIDFLLKRMLLEAPSDWPQSQLAHLSGTLDEEEDSFYLIRRKAVRALSVTFSRALTIPISKSPTNETPVFDNSILQMIKPLISLMATQSVQAHVPDTERTHLSENSLTLAAVTKQYDVQRLTFYALGPQLLKNCIHTLDTTGRSPAELAEFLFGKSNESQGDIITRRRVLLRELHALESVLKRLTLPLTLKEMKEGGFLHDLNPQQIAARDQSRDKFHSKYPSFSLQPDGVIENPFVLQTPLEEVCQTTFTKVLLLCNNYMGLWTWASTDNGVTGDHHQRQALWQIGEDEINELARSRSLSVQSLKQSLSFSEKLEDVMFSRHLSQIRIILFRLVGLLCRVLISSGLYGEIRLRSSDGLINTAELLVNAMHLLSDPVNLAHCPLVVKEMLVRHVLVGGILHGYSSAGLPATPTDTTALPIDPSCFFFPSPESLSFHNLLVKEFVQNCLPRLTHDVATEWLKCEKSREVLLAADGDRSIEDRRKEAMHIHHSIRLTQAVTYSQAAATLLLSLFTTSNNMPNNKALFREDSSDGNGEGGGFDLVMSHENIMDVEKETGEIKLPMERTIMQLRLILHTTLKQLLFHPSEITDALLAATASIIKLPHPELISMGHQAIRVFMRSTWKRIVSSFFASKVDSVQARRFCDDFSHRSALLFEFILSRAFTICEFDPSMLEPIDWSLLGPDALKGGLMKPIMKYHVLGGLSTSPLRPFLVLPFTVSKASNIRSIAVNAALGHQSFWALTIGTLYDILRAMAACFTVRCNVLILKRSAFASETSTEEVLMQLSLDPDLQAVIATLGDSTKFPWTLSDDAMRLWVQNIVSNRAKHDAKAAKTDLRHFILENLNKLMGGETDLHSIVHQPKPKERDRLSISLARDLSAEGELSEGDMTRLFGVTDS